MLQLKRYIYLLAVVVIAGCGGENSDGSKQETLINVASKIDLQFNIMDELSENFDYKNADHVIIDNESYEVSSMNLAKKQFAINFSDTTEYENLRLSGISLVRLVNDIDTLVYISFRNLENEYQYDIYLEENMEIKTEEFNDSTWNEMKEI